MKSDLREFLDWCASQEKNITSPDARIVIGMAKKFAKDEKSKDKK